MVLEQKHIINKLVVEVNTNSSAVAFKIKDKLSDFLKEDVLPYVEEYLDGVSPKYETKIVQIPKIEIEINASASRHFEELKSELKTAIEKKLSSLIGEPSEQNDDKVRILTKEEYNFNSLINFINTGTVSWLNSTDDYLFEIKQLKDAVLQKQFRHNFIKVLENQRAQIRLINQFSDDQIIYLLKNAFSQTDSREDSITSKLMDKLLRPDFFKHIIPTNNKGRQMLWQLIVNYLLYGQGKPANSISDYISQNTEELGVSSQDKGFKRSLQQILKELDISINQFKEPKDKKGRKRESYTTDDRNTNQKIDDDLFLNSDDLKEGIIVENAGLVLLHPYLAQFFKTCSLLDKKDQLTDKVLAAHLLHYLATKQEHQFENRMVFEKIICGIPHDTSINRHVNLSGELKRESEELLAAVISNWGALKNASPDLLRHEFLKRSGKISLKNNTLKVIVERKTQDILLDKLPWGISIIKTPWMKQFLTVEW